MGNTLNVNLPKISQKIYQEWTAKTRLVKSCSNEFEGEFDLTNLEIECFFRIYLKYFGILLDSYKAFSYLMIPIPP